MNASLIQTDCLWKKLINHGEISTMDYVNSFPNIIMLN